MHDPHITACDEVRIDARESAFSGRFDAQARFLRRVERRVRPLVRCTLVRRVSREEV
jgi:hypothetical protein